MVAHPAAGLPLLRQLHSNLLQADEGRAHLPPALPEDKLVNPVAKKQKTITVVIEEKKTTTITESLE